MMKRINNGFYLVSKKFIKKVNLLKIYIYFNKI